MVYSRFNDRKPVHAIFLDLKKAFDSVSHNLFLLKLRELGLCAKTVAWFRSYLELREQRANLDGILSTYQSVDYGVPQGPVSGPILFSIYIHSINRQFKYSKIKINVCR